MLAEVVESGKPPRAVALEGTFTGVFPNMASQMFTPGKAQIARREGSAEESLAFLLFRGGSVTPYVLIVIVIGIVLFSLGIVHLFVRR